MTLESIQNVRNFFSDYWLGSILVKKKDGATNLTAKQLVKVCKDLERLRERVGAMDNPNFADFREKFARPILRIFGFDLGSDHDEQVKDEPRLRLLYKLQEEGLSSNSDKLGVIWLCLNEEEADSRKGRNHLENFLATHQLDYGFILSPQAWRLIRCPGNGNKGASFNFELYIAVDKEDGDSVREAYRVLHANNFLRDEKGSRPIDRLEEESRSHSEKVSEDLKEAVFQSAEILVSGFLKDIMSRADAFPGMLSGWKVSDESLIRLRDAALQTLYRMLFILYAESRDDRLQKHRFYDTNYSLRALIDKVIHNYREGDFERFDASRCDFWQRLQALFLIYDKGLPKTPEFENIPPRGGTLFGSREKEDVGDLIRRLRLSDRVIGKLLITLTTALPRKGVGRERVSFQELEIEQLGAVYEGLLEYEPKIVEGELVEINVQGKEFVLSFSDLKRFCEQKNIRLKGDASIVEKTVAAAFLVDNETTDDSDGGTGDALENAEDEDEEAEVAKNGVAKLIRRLEEGDFYFNPGTARKSTGSFYTCKEIVDYLVKKSLKNFVEGKTPAEIERLRVIDPACGSAHFLIGAARYMGKHLYGAYNRTLDNKPPSEFYPHKDFSDEIITQWEKDGEAWCRRRVIERCLFGVDLNPTAVQLAQVALWIESLAGDRPLSFFEHHIRCGNSLEGAWIKTVFKDAQGDLFRSVVVTNVKEAIDERTLIDDSLPRELRQDSVEEWDYKQKRMLDAEAILKQSKLLFDLRCARFFDPSSKHLALENLDAESEQKARAQKDWEKFEEVQKAENFFHWELEFPEVFRGADGGFDVVLGNPPWEKVKPDRKEFYAREDVLIRAYKGGELDQRIKELQRRDSELADGFAEYSKRIKTRSKFLKNGGNFQFCDWKIDDKSTGGDPDLFKFFLERAHQILRKGGQLGFLVPSSIYNNEGCTGLRHLLLDHSEIRSFYSFENRNKIFDIDSRYKFVCLVAEKTHIADPQETNDDDVEFHATFMRHDVAELEQDLKDKSEDKKGSTPDTIQVLIKKSELEKFSPGTLAFLEYRSARDREIVLKMYGLLPGMTQHPLLGDEGEGTWNAKFYREFDMTNDKDLWTKSDGKLYTPKEVCGLDWPRDTSIPFSKVREAMAKKGFWPLYEGKHIEQFLIDIKPITRWVNLETAQKTKRTPKAHPKLVFRDIARNTDEHTCIAAVLPEQSCSGNTLATLAVSGVTVDYCATVLNSFAFDYITRFKTAGTHLNWTYVSRVAISSSSKITPILTQSSPAIANCVSMADRDVDFEKIWQANQDVAISYDLTPDDLDHIFNSFPVFARKRSAFFAYLRKRVQEWKNE